MFASFMIIHNNNHNNFKKDICGSVYVRKNEMFEFEIPNLYV